MPASMISMQNQQNVAHSLQDSILNHQCHQKYQSPDHSSRAELKSEDLHRNLVALPKKHENDRMWIFDMFYHIEKEIIMLN